MPSRLAGSDWVAVAVSAAVAVALVWLVRRNAVRAGLIDEPNHRSSHQQPTPRGGGVGIVCGAGAGLLVASALGAAWPAGLWTVLGAAGLVAAVGLVDDLRRLTPGLRLVTQLAAATVVIAALGPLEALPLPAPLNVALPGPVSWAASLLWITALTNFFNFMDGIDGLAGGQAVASLGGVVVAGWSGDASLVASCTAAASLGFLLHNWSPARIFMGDTGSGFLGFVIACLPFLAPPQVRGPAVVAVAVGLALFLLDPVETLFRRAIARKPLTGAHREHVYQQYLGPGEAAGTLASVLVAAGAALALLGALAFRQPSLAWLALVVALLVYLGERSMAKKSRAKREHAMTTETGSRL